MRLIVVAVFTGAYLNSFVSGEYDITTMYKFNSIESELDGEVIVNYLDTCDCSVHPETNALGKPYYIKSDKNKYNQTVFYPLQTSSKIPTLKFPFEESEWKTLISSGTSVAIQSSRKIADFLGIYKVNNLLPRLIKWEQNSRVILDDEDDSIGVYESLSDAINNENYFLFLSNEKRYATDFSFTIVKSNSNSTITTKVDTDDNNIRVCSYGKSNCSTYGYTEDDQYEFAILIQLKENLHIYDTIAHKMITSDVAKIRDFGEYKSTYQETHEGKKYTKNAINYKIVQLLQPVVDRDTTVASPWLPINNDSSLFIIYYRNKSGQIATFLKDQETQQLVQLDIQEENVLKLTHENQSDVDEAVLAKVNVRFPQNWTLEKQIQIKSDGHVFIKEIWEGGDEKIYQMQKNKTCLKSHISDIFDVALKDPTPRSKVDTCFNGGKLDKRSDTCACPPGFTGDQCEVACGRNSFGQKCSQFCSGSYTDTECKGMILCTPSYGCSCASGFYGDQCLQECGEGSYGADCKQTCGQCEGGCDRYTGHCKGECDSPYLKWPSCKHPLAYWKERPDFVDSTFTSVELSFDFTPDKIVMFLNEPIFYVVQYKEYRKRAWNTCSYETFNSNIGNYSVEGLKPGHKYYFRILLVDESLQINDPAQSKVSEGFTNCIMSKIHMNMSVNYFSNASIGLTWTDEYKRENNECPFLDYILDIHGSLDHVTEKRRIVNIIGKSFEIKFLIPGKAYQVNLRGNTVYGESHVLSNITLLTDLKHNTLIGKSIEGLKITKGERSEINLQWFKSPFFAIYYIKYKILRRLSCEIIRDNIDYYADIDSNWTVISTLTTKYSLTLEPNAQYQLFVTGDKMQEPSTQARTVVTKSDLPSIKPSLSKEQFSLTNESARLYLSDPPAYCKHLKGFFKNYIIKLMDTHDAILKIYNTEDTIFDIKGLDSNTNYKIRISYVNHVGYDPKVYEEYSFTTEATSLNSKI